MTRNIVIKINGQPRALRLTDKLRMALIACASLLFLTLIILPLLSVAFVAAMVILGLGATVIAGAIVWRLFQNRNRDGLVR